MGNMSFFENMIENKLKSLHTAYLAKVLSVNGSTAKIQPLGLTKAYGKAAQKQSILSSVPILDSAYKVREKSMFFVVSVDFANRTFKQVSTKVAEVVPIKSGDIVICVVCERDISEAKKGNNSTPALGHHSMSDSVIVGVL